MDNRMAETDPNRDPLEALAAEFAERQRRGESPSISDYAERHPELAEAIRDLFPALLAVERLKARTERTSGGRASLGPVKLERLGDFRIIREIGRGGMGIVYEAEQESLERRVAIKVLPRQSLLDPAHLARFHREAQTAAGLHHTNIVQVFGVGEHEGFHYYVMQLVRGVGGDRVISHLAEAACGSGSHGSLPHTDASDSTSDYTIGLIRELIGGDPELPGLRLGPHYWRSVARIGIQVADALGYAHSRGILHRDIKPGNLLLDDKGVVWIADFGLAKAIESDNVTQPGDVTGTLRYMAPERFQGRVDARSDIYSLGLTLYELLTLRPAYEDPDRTALLRRITQGEPAPPRRINAAIPHDLETVVLKAIAHDPDHRYASADELAADLRCFVEDRPVQSRRATSVERLWRWCRRNPAVATLASTTALLILIVAVVATTGYVRTKQAFKGEAEQRRKAEAVATVAQGALDRVFDRLSPNSKLRTLELSASDAGGVRIEVPSPPMISTETAALLEEMLPFYDRLAEQVAGDSELRQRTAEANRRVGDIRQLLGQYDQAAEAYRRAIAIYGDVAAWRLKTAETLNELGRLYRAKRQSDQANASHSEALATLQAIVPTASQPASVRYELARTYYFLGTPVLSEPGAKPRGPRDDRPPLPPEEGGQEPPPPDDRQPPPDERRPPPDDRQPPADERRPPPDDRQPPAEDREPPPPAGPEPPPRDQVSPPKVDDDNLQKAITLLKELSVQSPDRPEYRHMLALCDRDRHAVLLARDRKSAAESLDRAITTLERLMQEYPQVPEYRRDLSESYAMGDAQDPQLTHDEIVSAEERLQKASAIAEQLVAQYPQVPEYLSWQAQVCHRLGIALRKLHRLDEAEQYDRKAVSTQAKLAEHLPKIASHRVWLAGFRNSLADLLLLRGKLDEARPLVEETISMLDEVLKANPDMWFIHALLAESNRTLAAVLNRSGDQAGSSRARSQAQEHQRQLQDRQP
jgi:eukaryotic-like serine/threonine-protein kinase